MLIKFLRILLSTIISLVILLVSIVPFIGCVGGGCELSNPIFIFVPLWVFVSIIIAFVFVKKKSYDLNYGAFRKWNLFNTICLILCFFMVIPAIGVVSMWYGFHRFLGIPSGASIIIVGIIGYVLVLLFSLREARRPVMKNRNDEEL